MKLSSITGIGRTIDPNYPTNRAIILLSFLVSLLGFGYQLLSGQTWLQGALWGIGAGIAVFFAWAFCRELDPDHSPSAFIAAGLAIVCVYLFDLPALLALLWLMQILRVINHSTGLSATVVDSLAVLILAGWLCFVDHWGFGLLTAIGLLVDRFFPPENKRQIVFAFLALLITGIALVFQGVTWNQQGDTLSAIAMVIGLSIVFLPVILRSKTLESVGDYTEEPLVPRRVQAGQVYALLVGISVSLWAGLAGLQSMVPLWAAMIGATSYWLCVSIFKRV